MQRFFKGRGIYRHSCPNCGGANIEARLIRGLPCPQCISDNLLSRNSRKEYDILTVNELLKEARSLNNYRELALLEEESLRLIRFFEKAVESPPWGAQRTWARRLARRDSFSIVAPTGVGKTTFGVVASIYYACNGEKAYIILPTTPLVQQVERKALSVVEKVGCDPGILVIHSKLGRKKRQEAMEKLEKGEFGVLVTTAAFARKNVDLVSKTKYRLVFVDDVDAVLKSAKSVDTVLKIVGFTEEDLEKGVELLRLQMRRASLYNRLARLQEHRRVQAENVRKELARVEARISKLQEYINSVKNNVASLIVSTATGRPRGARVKLFRSLLGFEAGGRSDLGLRRVYDTYTYPDNGIVERVVELVRRLGKGGLVYVPIDQGIEGAETIAEKLRNEGIKAEAFHSKKPTRIIDEYARGELDVLVGVANYYGVLVRGLDLPEVVRYAIFAGVPRHKFSADIGDPHPARMIRLLSLLVEAPMEDIANTARIYMARLRDLMRRLSPAALHMIAERVMSGDVDESGSPTRLVAEAYNFLRQAMEEDDVWEFLESRTDVAVIKEDDKRYVLIADAPTYIQASGRTSRLYAGGITRGLSVVIVDYKQVLNGLIRRTQWFVEAKWHRLEDLDLDKVLREIDEDRRKVKELKRGAIKLKDLVKTALLVVESPNKARTIAGFFGQPSIRLLPGGLRVYEVAVGDYILSIAASGGHVYDLSPFADKGDYRILGESAKNDIFGVLIEENKKDKEFIPVYTSIKRCLDCGHQFTADVDKCPVCGSTRIRDSRQIVSDLRRIAWEVDTVLIGTDPDVEGEKIGWDVSVLLKPYSRRIERLEFHEVTKRAILEALKSTREFDQNLIDAQIVRRVEDRWIGFSLSPLLWCHFWRRHYCELLKEFYAVPGKKQMFISHELERCSSMKFYYNLSAGRVQTPVLGWIVQRTHESKKKVLALRIYIDGTYLSTRIDEIKGEVIELQKALKGKKLVEHEVSIEQLEEKEDNLYPPPPYTTDTLLFDASRILRMSAPETMRLAQNLFEWGLITYHRTDSTRVSDKGIQVAREWLSERFGESYKEFFKPRQWSEGGAHEAIRPTRPIDADRLRNLVDEGILEFPGQITQRHLRLYDLIFRRFIASQMREARVRRVKYKVSFPPYNAWFEVERVILAAGSENEMGFLLIWPYSRISDELPLGSFWSKIEVYKVPLVPLYTQGDVIEEMKKRGIGRPSTYAKIIETLLRRRYITRPPGAKGDYLISTIRGEHVYNYLTRNIVEYKDDFKPLGDKAVEVIGSIPQLVSEERTRQLEQRMTEIETGKTTRVKVLTEVYNEIGPLASAISKIPVELKQSKQPHSPFHECISMATIVVSSREGRRT